MPSAFNQVGICLKRKGPRATPTVVGCPSWLKTIAVDELALNLQRSIKKYFKKRWQTLIEQTACTVVKYVDINGIFSDLEVGATPTHAPLPIGFHSRACALE